MPTLHIALDESGDLTFSPKGTRYYTFAVAWTYNPSPLATSLTSLRFQLLKGGDDIASFHATEDKQAHRDAVVRRLVDDADWRFAAIVVEKAKVNPSVREPEHFYPKFAGMALRFVFKGVAAAGATQVVACTDSLPVAKRKDAVTKMFKTAARADLPPGTRFDIYHHPCESNKWIQIADYCAWSVHRKWERGDDRTYQQLATRLEKPELEVCARGDGTLYY